MWVNLTYFCDGWMYCLLSKHTHFLNGILVHFLTQKMLGVSEEHKLFFYFISILFLFPVSVDLSWISRGRYQVMQIKLSLSTIG